MNHHSAMTATQPITSTTAPRAASAESRELASGTGPSLDGPSRR
ncbi:MAG: hypothetical protein QOE28_1384 [Solirubrobacteraceae bacterium]|nr:hypothetical protein [Solirubrobacteraceae bacterium]